MQMLSLEEAVDRLAKANGVRWYGHVLRREDGHVLRRAFEFDGERSEEEGKAKEDVEDASRGGE